MVHESHYKNNAIYKLSLKRSIRILDKNIMNVPNSQIEIAIA